ncbi:hypothetical protein BJY16_000884 [Actinoplanes octamycinicus]|uniref:Uncharacterized protein n=1 Tax=Actinoplanes octamycinicus TaxID=135948 RepID=A0A7W7GSE7_9ACTN|nr:hypothetical protein [Actinoplanes octamycinicus]MBB4737425.1 hypothetical protein [Actinoplanes octamycinicus]GIE60290.1 hypothetical protein Aoc01nite_56920 [Actinoplanes octamycinicus]
MSAERDDGWPSIPTVLRVMVGWFLFGIGLLNLACGADGTAYLVFHVTVTLGGMILLALHRVEPSRAGYLIASVTGVAGLALGLLPVTDRCCLTAYPERRGYPYPFLGVGDGVHADLRYFVFDLVFWLCAGTIALVVTRVVEGCLPERRTPVDLTGYVGRHAEPAPVAGDVAGHAEVHAYVAQHRADENVGGLT